MSDCCSVCNKSSEDLYTCPKCNIVLCSVICYRNEKHVSCAEQFYKSCVNEELANQSGLSANNSRTTNPIIEQMKILREEETEESYVQNGDEELEEDFDGEDARNMDDYLKKLMEMTIKAHDSFNDGDNENVDEELKQILGIEDGDVDPEQLMQMLTNEEGQTFDNIVKQLKLVPNSQPKQTADKNNLIEIIE